MCVIPGRFCACCPACTECSALSRGRAVAITCGCVHHLSRTYRLICALHTQIGGFSKKAAMQTKKEMSSQWENISCKSLVASGNQRLLNLCGAEDVLFTFQSLRFRIEIITQNRKFCKPFDKIAALVTKINYVPCFFCASYPWQLRAMCSYTQKFGTKLKALLLQQGVLLTFIEFDS